MSSRVIALTTCSAEANDAPHCNGYYEWAGSSMEQVQVDGRDATRDTAMERLRGLEVALKARGYIVTVEEDRWSLLAKNEAAEPDDPRDPLARAYGSVKLSQRVQLAPDDTGALCWHWEWKGAEGDDGPVYERLCAADAIAEASECIGRVIALRGQQ